MAAAASVTADFQLSASAPEVIEIIARSIETTEDLELLAALQAGMVWLSRTGALKRIEYPAARPERYTRRQVYADPVGRFSIIAMTWGSGHATPLHDHAGLWCVEAVVEGDMQVINYQLMSEIDGLCRFQQRNTVDAHQHSSGGLIPPLEYHIFRNAGRGNAHTLHVYGGSMDHCDIFEPSGEGCWTRQRRELRSDV
jgi:predicted metal-dependent enzyme (double-stranded beta helix superfamily)